MIAARGSNFVRCIMLIGAVGERVLLETELSESGGCDIKPQ